MARTWNNDRRHPLVCPVVRADVFEVRDVDLWCPIYIIRLQMLVRAIRTPDKAQGALVKCIDGSSAQTLHDSATRGGGTSDARFRLADMRKRTFSCGGEAAGYGTHVEVPAD